MVALGVSPVVGQDNHRFNFGAGAGVSFPTQSASANLETGWNLDFRGGVNVSQNFLADLDFTYNHWGLTRTALAHFGQPSGYADVWALTFTPVIRMAPRANVNPYVMAGTGLYHRGLTLTQPATLSTIFCDPFFGFCYPAQVGINQVVASFSTYRGGFNAGGGLEFRLGSGGVRAFAEARYHQMFTSHGPDLTFAPLTFGLRW
jgi:opacity protein-like surface antigen